MTWPGIEPQSPRLLASTLLIWPIIIRTIKRKNIGKNESVKKIWIFRKRSNQKQWNKEKKKLMEEADNKWTER